MSHKNKLTFDPKGDNTGPDVAGRVAGNIGHLEIRLHDIADPEVVRGHGKVADHDIVRGNRLGEEGTSKIGHFANSSGAVGETRRLGVCNTVNEFYIIILPKRLYFCLCTCMYRRFTYRSFQFSFPFLE